MSNPLKYPSTPHWPWSQSVHRDDSTHSNPKHFLNTPLWITEKLDGGNTCLYRGEVYARSVVAPSRAGWMAMVRKHHAWKTVEFRDADNVNLPDFIFYGEDLYGVHSIEYDVLPETETYNLFSVCDPETRKFLSLNDVKNWANTLNFKMVPTIFEGEFKTVEEITDFFETNIKYPSRLGPIREGFVLRIADSFSYDDFALNVCKYVRKNHVQTDEHWTKNWRTAPLVFDK